MGGPPPGADVGATDSLLAGAPGADLLRTSAQASPWWNRILMALVFTLSTALVWFAFRVDQRGWAWRGRTWNPPFMLRRSQH